MRVVLRKMSSGTSANSKQNTLVKPQSPRPQISITIPNHFLPIHDLNAFLSKAKIQFEKKWQSNDIPRANIDDFERLRTIGAGSFGRVLLAKHKPSNTYCAIKAMQKAKMVSKNYINNVYSEMKIWISINFHFLVPMMYVMKDNSFIYFAMPFMVGGEMFTHLTKFGKFREDLARFYAAQVCLALEYLHSLDILYRDLKPENILIDTRGYIKLTDMTFCKIVRGRTYSFCGTPEYLAPDIILHNGYGKAVDWWSYGILLYEMCAGYTPFYDTETYKIYEKIISGKYKNASHFSFDLKSLISDMLQVNPMKRCGTFKGGVADIKKHKWFKNINWTSILNYTTAAPYVPTYTSEADCTNFDNIPDEPLRISEHDLYGKEFEKF